MQIGAQRKISLLSNYNWKSPPSPDRVKMDFQECKCLAIQSKAAQIGKFLFSCSEKLPKHRGLVNISFIDWRKFWKFYELKLFKRQNLMKSGQIYPLLFRECCVMSVRKRLKVKVPSRYFSQWAARVRWEWPFLYSDKSDISTLHEPTLHSALYTSRSSSYNIRKSLGRLF